MGTWLTAQVKIGDNPQNIDPSSVLELESTDKVLVITRVTTAQMNAIVPIQGALCYNTEVQAVHYFDGTQWVNIGNGGGTGGSLTADPIVNAVSTIVITPTGTGDNLEVAPNSISSAQIVDGGVNGVDIQDGSIGPGKLQDDSVTEDKLSENSVGEEALDNANIDLGDFNNIDVGYITNANLLSTDLGNALQLGAIEGLYYDEGPLNTLIQNNTDAINAIGVPNLNEVLQQGNNALNLKIEGLATPTNPADAATKAYVDAQAAAGGSDNQDIGPISLNASNILSIGIENGMADTIDLSSLAGGGGTTEEVDGTTLTGIGTGVDPFKIEPGTNGQVLTTVGANVVWATVTPGGGTTEEVDGTTLTGIGTGIDPFKIEPSLTNGQFLSTDATGDVAWADLPPSAGAALFDPTTISGTGTVGDEYTIANDGVSTIKILDANVTAAKIAPGGNDQILRTAADGLSVTWVDLPTGAGGEANTTSNQGTGGIGIVLPKNVVDLPFKSINAGPSGIISVTDDTAENEIEIDIAAAAAMPTPANQMLITNGTTNQVEWAPLASHTGTANSVFFADASTGAPTNAINPVSEPSFEWDPTARLNYGQLQIGLDGFTAPTDVSKVVIAETLATGENIMYPLLIQTSASAAANASTGILFSPETHGPGTLAKGALIYQRTGDWAIGDFHFLQTNLTGLAKPTTADKAFTVKNNKDIVLYGGIDINGIGLGTAGQVLTSTGTAIQWAAGGGSITVVSADTPNSIIAGTDGGALYDDTSLAAAIAANTAANTADTDQDPNNEIELPTGGSNGQILSLDASLNPVWSTGAGTSNNLATDNQIQDAEDRTYDLNNQNLVFTGLGNIGIGNTANPPSNKLHVAGAIRAEGIRNSPGTPTSVAYSFNLDPDTGINNTGADELTFVVGALPAMIITDESTTDSEILLNGSLELTEQLLDETGNAGTSGQVLTSTSTGTEWKNPAVLFMGKANGANSLTPAPNISIGGGAGVNTVTFTNPMPDANYIIQLTVQGDFRIYITNQTVNGFTVETFDNNTMMLDVATWHFTVLDF